MGIDFSTHVTATSQDDRFQDKILDGGNEKTGPWLSMARYLAHLTAAKVSQAAFDDAYTETAPTWYASLSTAAKATLKNAYYREDVYNCLIACYPAP